jgi:hypothetical protein
MSSRWRHPADVEVLGNSADAQATPSVEIEDVAHDLSLGLVDDQYDALASGLPSAGTKNLWPVLFDQGSAIAVWRPPTRPVAELRMGGLRPISEVPG